MYVAALPPAGLKEALGLREEGREANVWLVVPDDAGVFDGAEFVEGIRCDHPVQACVDLKGHPERAAEAGEALRRRLSELRGKGGGTAGELQGSEE